MTLKPFSRRNGVLHAECLSLEKLAAEVATPFYCYSESYLRKRYERLSTAIAMSGTRIAFAVKSNGNLSVLRILGELGAGADVVSEGEIRRCLRAGIPASSIVFSGVGKTHDELAYAIALGIHQINIESVSELDRIQEICERNAVQADVAIRLNPDIAAGGHDKISTGRKTDKFGLSAEEIIHLNDRIQASRNVRLVGLAVHIGSQINDVAAFRTAWSRLCDLREELQRRGADIERLDLGGGLGVRYTDHDPELDLDAYAGLLNEIARSTGAELTIEPGRWITAGAGVLVSRVIAVKEAGGKRIVIVDCAMNDLMRPTLYDAIHPVWPVRDGTGAFPAAVAGPVCESGDILAQAAALPELQPDDLLAIGMAGAYGAVLSSAYNARLLVPEIIVHDNAWRWARRRPTHEESMALEWVD